MQKKTNLITILIISNFLIAFCIYKQINVDTNELQAKDNSDLVNTLEIESSDSWSNFTFIVIDGNWTDAVSLGWCTGDGSWDKPYTLENFTIDNEGMGSGIFIYLILWIAIPEAHTTAQKLEMRGEPITIENIKKAVRDEFETVKKKMKF